MIQVRKNVFETNSSSTHSIVLGTDKQFDDWKAGKLIYCESGWGNAKKALGIKSGFVPAELVDKYMKQEYPDEWKGFDGEYEGDKLYKLLREEEFFTWDGFDRYWEDDRCLEGDSNSITLPDGTKVIAVCHYGYDG